jgi:hypothetical protein
MTDWIRSIAVVAVLFGWPAHAYLPKYQLDAGMNNVVALNHIFLNDEGCHPGGELTGRVAKVEFDQRGIIPSGFVMELGTGKRMFVNVPEVSIDTMSRVDMAWVVQGLQRFLREGSPVVAGVKACGNAPVLMLDSLRPLH